MPVTVIQRNGFQQLTRDALSEEFSWKKGMVARDLIPIGYEKALVTRGGVALDADEHIHDGDHLNIIGLPSGWIAATIAIIAVGVTIKHYIDKYGDDTNNDHHKKQSDYYGWKGISTRRGQGFGMPLIYGTMRVGGVLGGAKLLSTGPSSVGLYYLNLLGEGPLRKVGDVTENTESSTVDTLLLGDVPLSTYGSTARVSIGEDVPVLPGTTDPFHPVWFKTAYQATINPDDGDGNMDLKFTSIKGLRHWDKNFTSDEGNFPPQPDGSGLRYGYTPDYRSKRDITGVTMAAGSERDNKYIYWILDDKADSGTGRPGTLTDAVGKHTGNPNWTGSTNTLTNATRWVVQNPSAFSANDDRVCITGYFKGKNQEYSSDRQKWWTEVPDDACFTSSVDFYNADTTLSGDGVFNSRGKYGPYEYYLEQETVSGAHGVPNDRENTDPDWVSGTQARGWTQFDTKDVQDGELLYVYPYPGAAADDDQHWWSYFGSNGSTNGGWKAGTYDGSLNTLCNLAWVNGGGSNNATISGVWGSPGSIDTGANKSNITGGVPAMFVYSNQWATFTLPSETKIGQVTFNIEFPQGLYKKNTDGDIQPHEQTFEIQYKKHTGSTEWVTLGYFKVRGKYTGAFWHTETIGTTQAYNGAFNYMSNYEPSPTVSISMQNQRAWTGAIIPGTSTNAYHYANRIFTAGSEAGVNFRVSAVGKPDDYGSSYTQEPINPVRQSSAHLSSLTYHDQAVPGGGLNTMPGTAWVELAGVTSYQTNSEVPDLTVIVDGVNIKSYRANSTADTIHADSKDFANPAWVTLDLLINKVYGGGGYINTDIDIDWQSFVDWSEFCGVDSVNGALNEDKRNETYTWVSPLGEGRNLDVTTTPDYTMMTVDSIDPTTAAGGFWVAARPGDVVLLDPELQVLEAVEAVTIKSMSVSNSVGIMTFEEDLTGTTALTALASMVFNVVVIGPRCQFNGAFDEDSSLYEAIEKVLNVGRATLVREGTRFRAVPDDARSVSQVFSEGAIKDGSLSVSEVSAVDVPTDIEIQYLDAELNYDRETVRMSIPGFESSTFSNERKLSNEFVVGITDRAAAESYAYYKLLKYQYNRKSLQMEVSLEGLAAQVGDRIQVQHRDLTDSTPFNIAGWGSYEPESAVMMEDQTTVIADRDINFNSDKTVLVVITGIGTYSEFTPLAGQGWTCPAGTPFAVAEVAASDGTDYTGFPAFLATDSWSESDWVIESIETTKDGFRKIGARQYDERTYDDGGATSQMASMGNPGGPPLGGAASSGWDTTAQSNSLTITGSGSGFRERTMATALDNTTPAAPVVTVPSAFTTAVGALPQGETLLIDSFCESYPSAIANSTAADGGGFNTRDKITTDDWFISRLGKGSIVQFNDAAADKNESFVVVSFVSSTVFLIDGSVDAAIGADVGTVLSISNYIGTSQTVTVESVSTNDITLSAALSQIPTVNFSVTRQVFSPTSHRGLAPSGLTGTRKSKLMPDGTAKWGIELTWDQPSVDPLSLADPLALGMANASNSLSPWMSTGVRQADAKSNGYQVWIRTFNIDDGATPTTGFLVGGDVNGNDGPAAVFASLAEEDTSSPWVSLGRVEEEIFQYWEASPNTLYKFAVTPIAANGSIYQPHEAPSVTVSFTLYDAKELFRFGTIPPSYPCPAPDSDGRTALSFDGQYVILRIPQELVVDGDGVIDQLTPPTLYSSSVFRQEGAIPDYYEIRLQGYVAGVVPSWDTAIPVQRTRDRSTLIPQLGKDPQWLLYKPNFKSGMPSSSACLLYWEGYTLDPLYKTSSLYNSSRTNSWPGTKRAVAVPAGESYLQVRSTIAADEDYITEALDAGAVAGGEVRKVQCVPCTEVLDEGTIFDGNTTKFSDPEAHNRMWEGDNYEHYADIETHYATSNDDVTYSDYVPFVGTFQATKRYYKIKTVIKRHTSDAAVRIEEVATRILSSA